MMKPESRRRLLAGLLLAVLAAAILGVMLWRSYQERQAIEGLAPEQRRALFESSLENFKLACMGTARETLERYCLGQAAFLRNFPECGEDCRQLLSYTAPEPTR